MDIAILSSGRAGNQTTFSSLPARLLPSVSIVVPYDEIRQYWHFSAYAKVIQTPEGIKGVGPTRQWIIENFGRYVVMLDDDLVFARRRTDEPDKFRDATEDNIFQAFAEIESRLHTYAHVGMSTREGGNRITSEFTFNTRMLRILAYDTAVLKDHNIRFDRMEVMEDFDVTLSLLRRGYDNILLNWIVHNQNGSNLAGGCSQYRTDEMQARAAYKLAELHPGFVTVVKKQTKVAWGGKERTDVRIQWKKARGASILDQRTGEGSAS